MYHGLIDISFAVDLPCQEHQVAPTSRDRIPLTSEELSRVTKNSPLARKLGVFVALSDEDHAMLDRLHQRRRKFVAGVDLVHQGQVDQSAYILAKGWVCSYKILANGGRQIVDFQIPGDFLGLRSVLFRTADHNIEPVTQVEASEVIVADLLDAFARTPRLATAVLWAASRDEAMVVEHLVGIGRRNALERTAHYLLELGARLKLVGLGTEEGYACPLSQYMLADALGLSAVHINRVLRQLREMGLLTFQKGRVRIDDFDGLVALAEFDKAYLDHDGPLLR
jgi:CRP-like cAMP-binding protein